jgi:hypothetical protein
MGMRPPVFFAPIFVSEDPKQVLFSFLAIKDMMEALCKVNIRYLQMYGERVPDIYKSGVVYDVEDGTEEWLTIPYIMAAKWGDCEDLACWRAAELVVRHRVNAKPDVRARRINGVWRAHAIVRLPDGSTEDPSVKLGMPDGGTSGLIGA